MDSYRTLSGTIAANGTIAGSVATGKVFASVDVDYYEGNYEVVPKVDSQTLETREKIMKENLIIKEIPVYEVTNNAGGTTVYIAKEI